MITRKINTNLMKKLETFKVMALGEAIQTPILLIGPPGVAKTAAVIDFAKASLGTLKGEDLFLLETDEGTKSNAVKGNIDLEALTTKNEYRVDSPVTRAKVVVVNEIDKASASLRNSLLGIMNERVLFNGKQKLPCKWKNFIATCNEIPDEEKDSPFWDRFLITHDVKRLSPADMMNYYNKGGKTFRQNHNVKLPEQADIDAITLTPARLKIVLDTCHSLLSDRALSFLPTLIKNVMVVWGYDESRGMVKTAELLIGKNEAKNLAKNLVPAQVRAVHDTIDAIGMCVSPSDYNDQYDRFELAYGEADRMSLLSEDDKIQLKERMAEEESKLGFLTDDSDVNTDAI